MTDANGVVQSTYFDTGTGYRAEGWFTIHPEMQAAPGAPVTAGWRDARHLELFVVDSGRTVRSDAWDANDAAGWSNGWISAHLKPNFYPGLPLDRDQPTDFTPGTRVVALWNGLRRQGEPIHLDLFATATNGSIQSTFREERKDTYLAWQQKGTLALVLPRQTSILGIQCVRPGKPDRHARRTEHGAVQAGVLARLACDGPPRFSLTRHQDTTHTSCLGRLRRSTETTINGDKS